MRKMAVLFIFIFLLVIVTGVLITQSLVVMQRIAHLSDVVGRVQVKAGGQSEFGPLVGTTRHVMAGDTLSTGPKASLTLNWIDGTRMKMGPETVLTVLKCQLNKSTDARTSVFKLDTGQVWIRILKILTQQSKFEIRTPTATAGVRGTVFSVKVAPDGNTQISVYEGTVSVQTTSGSVQVTEQRIARLGRSGSSPQLAQFSGPDHQAWQSHLSNLGPYLQITHPGADETISGDSVKVTGICEQGATLAVNEQTVIPRPKGRFSVQLPVSAEQPTFAIRAVATDANGQTTTLTRTLRLRATGGG